jgi:hypothetical protein
MGPSILLKIYSLGDQIDITVSVVYTHTHHCNTDIDGSNKAACVVL